MQGMEHHLPTMCMTLGHIDRSRIKSAKYLVVGVNNFYLNNPMPKHEYYNISFGLIPQDTIYKYDLADNKINGFLYVRVEQGMYGLVQAVITSHTGLREHICPFVYDPAPIMSGLWFQNKKGIIFTLVVENFGIRYQRREDAQDLINALQEKYEIKQDCAGSF